MNWAERHHLLLVYFFFCIVIALRRLLMQRNAGGGGFFGALEADLDVALEDDMSLLEEPVPSQPNDDNDDGVGEESAMARFFAVHEGVF